MATELLPGKCKAQLQACTTISWFKWSTRIEMNDGTRIYDTYLYVSIVIFLLRLRVFATTKWSNTGRCIKSMLRLLVRIFRSAGLWCTETKPIFSRSLWYELVDRENRESTIGTVYPGAKHIAYSRSVYCGHRRWGGAGFRDYDSEWRFISPVGFSWAKARICNLLEYLVPVLRKEDPSV